MSRRARVFPYNGNNYRSEYERRQAKRLDKLGIKFQYEEISMEYLQDQSKAVCTTCGGHNIAITRSYTPDFYFPDKKLFVETKGRFTAPDRTKMKLVCQQSDDDIRIVFMRENWLTKKHKMSYSRWCEINNIQYAMGDIPLEWIE